MVVPAFVAFSVACLKEVAKAQPNVPPVEPAPTATLAASPANIQHGQSATLTWQTTNANNVNIAGLGSVPASGSRPVTPEQSTTYDLSAKGPGGSADASARVTVNWPASNYSPGETTVGPQEAWEKGSRDVYFDYNRFDLRPDQMTDVQTDAQLLKKYGELHVNIEGHCDERGSLEYNMALGAKRAHTVEQTLERLGVSKAQLQTVSYGKERPFCNTHNEPCWQENRRDHFSTKQ